MSEYITVVAASIELVLILAGAVLLWRLVASPTARARFRPSPLPAWDVSLSEFLMFLLFIMGGTVLALFAAGALAKYLPFSGDELMVFNGAAAQFGMLAGVALHRGGTGRPFSASQPQTSGPNILVSGGATFLMALPILVATAKTWELFLEFCGLPVERQDLLRMFANADSPLLLVSMVLLAVVIAPLAEEFVFRAGIFRYFRTRIPRLAALLVPALIFASLHVENWETLEGFAGFAPLAALAVIFAIAYERTGRIGTPIVAHALFNLNTILLLLAGVGDE